MQAARHYKFRLLKTSADHQKLLRARTHGQRDDRRSSRTRDGWGMAFTRNDQWEVHKSGRNLLEETDQCWSLLDRVGGCPILLLHLRKSAWSNTATARHAHPFQWGNAVFAHNGTITDFQGLIRGISVPGLKEDVLDTEVFFLHVMSDPSPDRREAFLNTVSLIKRNYAFSALNCSSATGGTSSPIAITTKNRITIPSSKPLPRIHASFPPSLSQKIFPGS